VEIIWHGHACFEVRGEQITLVFDPFGGIGLPEPKAQADIVLCSHSHGDHNNVEPVLKAGGVVLEGFVGSQNVHNVLVKGIATLHDAAGGSQRGKNAISVVNLDGLKLCHLGDLGHDLSSDQAQNIGVIDVLFTPVAGGATIGPVIASSIIEKLGPNIIVPMHYDPGLPGTPSWFPRAMPVSIEEFLRGKENVAKIQDRSITITKENLSEAQTIIVLSYGI
jgi:L-ascorbate metabolism protein UlaG (beta-lactamase superfamily)